MLKSLKNRPENRRKNFQNGDTASLKKLQLELRSVQSLEDSQEKFREINRLQMEIINILNGSNPSMSRAAQKLYS